MSSKLTGTGNHQLSFFLMACMLVLLYGCNTNNLRTANSPVSKSIKEILVYEEEKSWDCVIKGNNPLAFSAINHISPTGILLYFPDTTLDIPATAPPASANEIISSIEANESPDGSLKNSRILIALNTERPYRIYPEENGLRISFPKTLAQPLEDETIIISAETNGVGTDEHDAPSANLLKTVTATPLKDHIIVNVDSDGTIADYDSFAIDNPPRIVFDIYHIESPHKAGQKIEVDSQWVKRIRYNPYPDKIRLVLDTEKQYLTKYFSFPTGSGLLIYVGRMPENFSTNFH